MNTKVLLLLGLVVVVGAERLPSYSYGAPEESDESDESYESDESEPPKYDFTWAVKDHYSGNDFTHAEARDEDDTQGSYYVQLPDSRLQKVTYYVDGDSGYVAEVTYEGEARYPESSESREYGAPPRPRYSSPESEESHEAPVYAPPPRSYGYPQ